MVALDTKKSAISLDSGHVISYDKCLLATGGHPKTLPLFDKAAESVRRHVSVYREVRLGTVGVTVARGETGDCGCDCSER